MSTPIPAPGDRGPYNHAREWQAHVEAGRIGRKVDPGAEHLIRYLRNEEVVLGLGRSVRVRGKFTR